MSMQDRPARPGRTKPVPTADAGVDPVEYRPTTTKPPVAATRQSPLMEQENVDVRTPATESSAKTEPLMPLQPVTPGGPQATVQLGVNVDPQIAQLVMQIKARTGLSKRAIVEKAIRETWAT